jgi:hypothetical protein
MSRAASRDKAQRQWKVKAPRLHRRTLLRGLGGLAVGLPVLECMLDPNGSRLASAQSSGLPQRYGIVFAGQSLGGDEWAKDENRVAGENFTEAGHFIVPPQLGLDHDVTTPLVPLADLMGEFTLFSNMSIPYDKNSAEPDAVPAGGAYRDFHGGGKSPLLSGVRSTSPDFRAGGITSDQVVAELKRGNTLIDSLVYRAQPSWYLAGSSYAGRQYISYGAGAERIEAQVSPLVAYQSLFDNFTPDEGEAQVAHDFRQRARASVLDLIGDKRDQVLVGLSTADRQRIERHYDELRQLESRIDGATELAEGQCTRPDPYGDDPPIGADNAGSGSSDIATNTGYSNEHLRARLLADLVHMALVCDLTQVFTLQLTVFQSHMNVFELTNDLGLPIRADLHEVGHNGDQDNRGQICVSTCLQWHVSHYAYLLDKLRNTPEGDGNVLDNSAIFFMPEGGHGTQLNDAVSENQTHSVEQMVLLLAGRAGGLVPRGHVDATGYHPVQALISGMRAAGFEGDSLGEVSGFIPDVFG